MAGLDAQNGSVHGLRTERAQFAEARFLFGLQLRTHGTYGVGQVGHAGQLHIAAHAAIGRQLRLRLVGLVPIAHVEGPALFDKPFLVFQAGRFNA